MILALASSILVLHMDFNTIQMKKEAVVDCLREAAGMGYNAVLWEVENKVCWETCPECVDPEAFSKDEFRQILAEADCLGLEPIPLMQTFGHAEYILRHDKYAGWKESPSSLACYCVSRPEVLAFQKALLREYLDLFGNRVRRFHLGGDEAFAFGTCPHCRTSDKMDLYVRHLNAVSEELIAKGIRPGVWADMVLAGGDCNNRNKADIADDVMQKLPRSFTLWNWDYYHGARPQKGDAAATPRLTRLGYEVILSAASQSAMDGPFLPQFKAHRDNIAACAEDVRAQKLAGLCVTSWSVHLYPKTLQYPLWEFAARRLVNPSKNAEADFATIVKKRWGEVPVDVFDRLSIGRWGYSMFDTRFWGYEKRACPATPGLLAERIGKLDAGDGRQSILDRAREDLRMIEKARSELGNGPLSVSALRQLEEAGALSSAFLSQMIAVLENRRADGAVSAIQKAEHYYSSFQTPQSAKNAAHIAWSVLAQGEQNSEISSSPAAANAEINDKVMVVCEFVGEAIQRAIDVLAKNGGGKVIVPPGTYPITNIRLRSGIELHLAKGAVLCGPTNPCNCVQFPRNKSVTMVNMGVGLIQAWNEKNIAITGEGAIDANGSAYFDTSAANYWGAFFHPKKGTRPEMVQLCRCTNVRMSGVSFLNSPCWTMRIRLCENIDIEGIKVINDLRYINADGIDFDACRHVRMRNSKFLTGDDSIVLLATREPDSIEPIILEDVVVENCDLESACQTIRVGCPSEDTVRNVLFRNIRAKGFNGINFDYPVRYLSPGDEGYINVHDIGFDGYSGEFSGCALQIVVENGVKIRGVRDVLFKDFNVVSAKPVRFVENKHSKFMRLKRVNFTLNGTLLHDGEFETERNNE